MNIKIDQNVLSRLFPMQIIAPAMKLFDELRSAEPDGDADMEELEERIEDAEALIAEAELTVENAQDALAHWKLE